MPLLINLFASKRRMAWALGCESIDEAVARIEEPLGMGPPDGLWDKVRMLGKLKDWGGSTPKTVAKRPLPGGGDPGRGAAKDAACWT